MVDIVREAAGPTLLLSLTAWLLHLVLAVAAAVVMAARRGSTLDHLVGGVGLVLLSLPGFWLGLMLTLLFARQLGWLPAGACTGPTPHCFRQGHACWTSCVTLCCRR